jgi:hypothetical protein
LKGIYALAYLVVVMKTKGFYKIDT